MKRSRIRLACDACRKCKTKCDGVHPCSACYRSIRKRENDCTYSQKSDGTVAASEGNKEANPPESGVQSIASLPGGSRLHRRFSVHRIVDDFIDIGQMKSRPKYIDRIQGNYSDIRTLMHRKTIHVTPPSITQPPLGTRGPLAIEYAASNGTALFLTGDHRRAHEELLVWQFHLDTDIEQEIKQGNLIDAWNSVNNAMSGLEIIDINYDLIISETEQLQSLARSLWLRLVEWECILSFFVCGKSRLSSWLGGKFLAPIIKQEKLRNTLFANRIDLHCEIQDLLQIDLAQEEGVYKLLQYIVHLQRLSEDMPSAKLKQIATKKPGKDSVQEQELHLIANLALVMLHCRTATICAYYNEESRKALPKRLSDLLKREELEPSKLRAHLMTPASRVLDSFMKLCMLDLEGTTNSWCKIYSVLVAAVIVTVIDIKTQKPCKESVKRQIRQIRDYFESAKSGSYCNALLEKGMSLLDDYLTTSTRSRQGAATKGKATQSRKHHSHALLSSQKSVISQARNSRLSKNRIARPTKLLDKIDRTSDRGLSSYNERLGSAVISLPVQATQMVSEQDGEIDACQSNDTSFTTAYACPPVEHADFAQYHFDTNVNLGNSFVSIDSATVAQSPVSNYYLSNGVVDSLPHETPSSPYTLYPEYPPTQVLRVPYRHWPGKYSSYNEKCAMAMAAHEGMTAFTGHTRYQQDLGQIVQTNYDCQMPAPRFDVLGQHIANSTEGLEQAAASFGSDPMITSGSATHFGMDQASTFEMGVPPPYSSQVYQQGFNECNAAASMYGQGRGFGEE